MESVLFGCYTLCQSAFLSLLTSTHFCADVIAFSGARIGIPVLILIIALAIVTGIIIRTMYKKNKN